MASNAPTETPTEIRRLRMLMLIRQFEERAYREYTRRPYRIGGFCHLSSGQEALAVGVAEVFERGRDYFIGSFRCHGYALALGMSPWAAMAELFGRVTGCCKGKGGSMQFFQADLGHLGGYNVAGAQLPLGVGAAFACRYRRTGGEAGGVCFIAFGDGAVNQGTFNESMNLAALYKLPAVFLLEDNGIAMGTKVERHSADPDLVRRGRAYEMPSVGFDGNDLDEVIRHLREASDRARRGEGPSYLVGRTYRFRGFSRSDAMRYRTKEELERARLRDPILIYELRLRERGLLDEARVEAIEDEVRAVVDDAVTYADESAHPDLEERFADVLAGTYPQAK